MEVQGKYYLQNVMETASGFNIGTNGRFEFFFSYGALDRAGYGTWTLLKDIITLNSSDKHETDFKLVGTRQTGNGRVTVRVVDNTTWVLKNIKVSLDKGTEGSWKNLNAEGEASFPSQTVSHIALFFEFCPEKISLMGISMPGQDDFPFNFEPWVLDYYFDQFTLRVADNSLHGKHPMLLGDDYTYLK